LTDGATLSQASDVRCVWLCVVASNSSETDLVDLTTEGF